MNMRERSIILCTPRVSKNYLVFRISSSEGGLYRLYNFLEFKIRKIENSDTWRRKRRKEKM